MSYVTTLVNAIMRSPDWSSTAIFLTWDDWGGFYDHVVPPRVDEHGYGLRVPGLVISPYARKGVLDDESAEAPPILDGEGTVAAASVVQQRSLQA